MTEYQVRPENSGTLQQRRKRVSGVVLVVIGCFLLAAQFLDSSLVRLMILPFIGILLLVWGAWGRNRGTVLIGGVLLGIGVGRALSQEVFYYLGQPATTGIFLVCSGLGWVIVCVMPSRFGGSRLWWPLVPGIVLVAVGIPLILACTAPEVVKWIATYWPALLIIAGIALAVRTRGG